MNRKDVLERVVKAQEGFTYEKIVSDPNCRVYLCRKPGTRTYSFEIVVGQYGIYLNGDIDCLVWDVPRDIHFLAGTDVDYYIHSKLAAVFREQDEVDPDKRDEWLVQTMVQWLEEHDDQVEGDIPFTSYIENLPALSDVAEFFVAQDLDGIMKDCDVWQLYEEVNESEELETIYHEAARYDPDFFHNANITRHKWSVVFCMYMACYAARKIVEAGIA